MKSEPHILPDRDHVIYVTSKNIKKAKKKANKFLSDYIGEYIIKGVYRHVVYGSTELYPSSNVYCVLYSNNKEIKNIKTMMMNQEEKNYKKLCSEFLSEDESFLNDWNSIMDVVEKINTLNNNPKYKLGSDLFNSDWNRIMGSKNIIELNMASTKEAVKQAITSFLTWYNKTNS